MARTPQEAFYDWKSMKPKSDKRTLSEFLHEFYERESDRMHSLNQQAVRAGKNAAWAFREKRALAGGSPRTGGEGE